MFHLHVRYRSRDGGGSCESARQYIVREGRYQARGDKVRWAKSLHMPDWAGGDSAPAYWKAAEGRCSRENARTAILIEFAVPKDLSPEQQEALVMDFAEQLSSMCAMEGQSPGKLPLTVALHEGYGRNPHVHALLSTSIADGNARSADRWFRRYNAKVPAAGGARRSVFVTKRGWLYAVRNAWASLANKALSSCGRPPALDHRSHAKRGLTIEPQIHLGPSVAHMVQLGKPTPRSQRNDAIKQQHLIDRELEEAIKSRSKRIEGLKLELLRLDDAARDIRLHCDREMRRILTDHPFNLGVAETIASAAALVTGLPSDKSLESALATRSVVDFERFCQALGTAWLCTRTGGAFWAVGPSQDSVVILRNALVATAADDADSLLAMIRVASLLDHAQPMLFAQSRIAMLARDQLERMGLQWPLQVLEPKPLRRRLRP